MTDAVGTDATTPDATKAPGIAGRDSIPRDSPQAKRGRPAAAAAAVAPDKPAPCPCQAEGAVTLEDIDARIQAVGRLVLVCAVAAAVAYIFNSRGELAGTSA